MSANDHTTATDSHDEAHTGPITKPSARLAMRPAWRVHPNLATQALGRHASKPVMTHC